MLSNWKWYLPKLYMRNLRELHYLSSGFRGYSIGVIAGRYSIHLEVLRDAK